MAAVFSEEGAGGGPPGRALLGCFLSLGSPVGWAIIELVLGRDLLASLRTDPYIYLYLTLGTMVAFTLFGFYVGRSERALARMSIRDSVTGLYNNRMFHERMRDAKAAAQRFDQPFCVLQLEIDHFDQIGEAYGERFSDAVLHQAGDALLRVLGGGDVPARLAVNCFAVILENRSEQQASQDAKRMQEAIATCRSVSGGDRSFHLSVLAGLASSNDVTGDEWMLVRASGRALKECRRRGGHELVLFSSTADRG